MVVRTVIEVLTLEETIELILKHTEHQRDEVLKMIEEKRQELGPEVVNEESAAMIIARELGIDLQQVSAKARIRIEDITESTGRVPLTARVVSKNPVRTFTRKDGGEGKVASLFVADETGEIRVTLWDEITRVVEEDIVKIDDVIQLRGGYVKKGLGDALEINMGRMSGIKILDEYELEDLGIDFGETPSTKIGELLDEKMYNISVTAKIQKIFPLTTFSRDEGEPEGKVLRLVVADETGETGCVFWDKEAEEMENAKVGEVFNLRGGYTKRGRYGNIEIHAGRSAQIERELKVKIDAVESTVGTTSSPVGMKKIADITLAMRDLDVEGKVVQIFPVNTFDRDGKEGRVQNIIIADETAQIRLTFWNEDVDKIKDLKVDNVISVMHVYAKEGYRGGVEIHMGRNAEITINPKGSKLKKLKVSAVPASAPEPIGKKELADITVEMRDVDVEGKVVRVFPVNTFDRDGKEGRVQNIIIADETAQVRLTFWNEDVDKIKALDEGDVIAVTHAYAKEGFRGGVEVHVGRRAEIEINPKGSRLEQLELTELSSQPKTQPAGRVPIGDIDDSSEGKSVEVCGIVVGISQKSPIYPACPSCRKKVEEEEGRFTCAVCGDVKEPEYRMLYKITVDDGSGSIRTTLFGEAGESLLQMTAVEAQELITNSGNRLEPLEQNSDRTLGRYVAIQGRVSKFKDSLDITASSITFPDPVEESKRMREAINGLMS
ncbi:MAG: OB-fold nucleic acid binding domain-containing protein [Candidatus Thorarchaeota archaeon]